jgi:hypothetical protein
MDDGGFLRIQERSDHSRKPKKMVQNDPRKPSDFAAWFGSSRFWAPTGKAWAYHVPVSFHVLFHSALSLSRQRNETQWNELECNAMQCNHRLAVHERPARESSRVAPRVDQTATGTGPPRNQLQLRSAPIAMDESESNVCFSPLAGRGAPCLNRDPTKAVPYCLLSWH